MRFEASRIGKELVMEEIVTDRLVIRRFKPNDWQDLYEYLSDEEVVKLPLALSLVADLLLCTGLFVGLQKRQRPARTYSLVNG